ncbi:MAG: GTPase [Pseudomonadota bacterium]
MTVGQTWRVVLGVVLFALLALVLNLILGLTDRALTLWERLADAPVGLRYGLLASFVMVGAGLGVFFWRLLFRRSRRSVKAQRELRDPAALQTRAQDLAEQGIDTEKARQTLAELAEGANDELDIVLFGAVSTGKSSLARALLPDAVVEVSPVAGSTRDVQRFVWEAKNGAMIRIADLPGLEAVGGEVDAQMMDEARRAHVVVFVTDSDLTRQQTDALKTLRATGKPMIVSLNKADRYNEAGLSALKRSIADRLDDKPDRDSVAPVLVVTIAGGEQDVVVTDAAGEVHRETRTRGAEIQELVLALEELIGGDLQTIHALRERALLDLATEQLAQAEQDYRQRRAEEIVTDTTRKAVIGALAAVTPGTDVVIQGYLGTDLTRRLCRLYGEDPRDLEISRFLDLSQSRVGKVLPITLAIAGNALKAFPGVGTIAGGLVHAVAYGLIFDAVGRGLAISLADAGALRAQQAADAVADQLDGDLKRDVGRIARLALDHWRESDRRE